MYTRIYRYREDLYKVILLYKKDLFNPPGFEDPGDLNDHKTADNLRRAQRTIEDIALCNPWQWFGTFTLDPQKYDRKDLDKFRKDFSQFIKDQRKKYSCHTSYMSVPELHKKLDGWHLHGLLYDLPLQALRPFTLDEKLPSYIRQKLKQGYLLFDWPDYRKKFGYVLLESVRSRDAAARYLVKYLRKDSGKTALNLDLHKHLYYCSKGLKHPDLFATYEYSNYSERAVSSHLTALPAAIRRIEFAYEFDYGQVLWVSAKPSITEDAAQSQ